MRHNTPVSLSRLPLLAITLWFGSLTASAQPTAFTYQGQLNVGGNPANASYDMQFKLFDALTAGTQIGSTATLTNVTVTNGVFTVTLDFGAAAFPGANRWLEISVRLAGSGTYTTLTPRQPLTSTPYAIKSLNAATADGLSAACVGCVSSTQIGAGSGNYIQNTTTEQQQANFNIAGNGVIWGNLGIGANPMTKLHISEFGDARLRLETESSSKYAVTEYKTPPWTWHTGVGGSAVSNDLNSKYYIYDATLGQTRMVITPGGNVGIGTTAPAAKLDTAGTIRSTAQTIPTSGEGLEVIYAGGNGYLTSYNRSSSAYRPLFIDSSFLQLNGISDQKVQIGKFNTPEIGREKLEVFGRTIIQGDIHVSGCLIVGLFVIAGFCSSDLRLKRQVTPFPNLLDKVARLQPVHFYWRADEFPKRHFGGEQSYGLIAQEVEEVLPELVTKDKEGYRAVNYSKLPLMMLQAIKEMKGEQDTLKQQNATLQTRLATLEQMMKQLVEQAEKQTPKQR